MTKFLREPLLHFLVLGALLFAAHTWVRDRAATRQAQQIDIDAAQVALLAQSWAGRWNRPPTEDELRGLIDARVREEILYREALKVGFDRDDPIVRRRMVQKMEMLTQDLASMSDPTDAELQAFLDDNVENYRVPPRMRFTHVYFNPDRRGNSVESDARQALEQIRSRRPVPQQVDDLGDRFLPGQNSRLRTPDEVARDYGTPFAEALFDLSAGWHGPLVSGYGLHLVHVIERVESRVPTLDQVRRRLVTDLQRTRREEAMEGLYQALLEGYRIEIDEVAIEDQAIAVP